MSATKFETGRNDESAGTDAKRSIRVLFPLPTRAPGKSRSGLLIEFWNQLILVRRIHDPAQLFLVGGLVFLLLAARAKQAGTVQRGRTAAASAGIERRCLVARYRAAGWLRPGLTLLPGNADAACSFAATGDSPWLGGIRQLRGTRLIRSRGLLILLLRRIDGLPGLLVVCCGAPFRPPGSRTLRMRMPHGRCEDRNAYDSTDHGRADAHVH